MVKIGLGSVKTVLKNGSIELQETQELASSYQTGPKTEWESENMTVRVFRAVFNVVVNLSFGELMAK